MQTRLCGFSAAFQIRAKQWPDAVIMLTRFASACDGANMRSSQCRAYLSAVVVLLYAQDVLQAFNVYQARLDLVQSHSCPTVEQTSHFTPLTPPPPPSPPVFLWGAEEEKLCASSPKQGSSILSLLDKCKVRLLAQNMTNAADHSRQSQITDVDLASLLKGSWPHGSTL